MEVLLIEPDKESAELYATSLEAIGLDTVVVPTAQGALDFLDKSHPRCIVTELDILNHNGFEFLYEFVSHHDWSDIPIIINSVIPKEKLTKMIVDLSEMNVVDYLYKGTATLQQLQNAVVSCIDRGP